jgi:hypothetical protein
MAFFGLVSLFEGGGAQRRKEKAVSFILERINERMRTTPDTGITEEGKTRLFLRISKTAVDAGNAEKPKRALL